MVTNNFNRDMRAEEELANYLAEYYYPRMGADNFQRCTDINQQLSGIDVIVKRNNQILLIDEKGLLSKLKPIRTFALELLYKKNGILKLGWLFDDAKTTTHYLLTWVKRDEVDLNVFKEENLHYALVMLVNRNKLLKYLESEYGITKDSAYKKALRIIEVGEGGSLEKLSEKSSSKYFYSNQLPEQPVNIIFDKNDFLESGAIEDYQIVKRSGLADPKI